MLNLRLGTSQLADDGTGRAAGAAQKSQKRRCCSAVSGLYLSATGRRPDVDARAEPPPPPPDTDTAPPPPLEPLAEAVHAEPWADVRGIPPSLP